MKKIAPLIWLLVVAAACFSVADAQTQFRELNADSRGRGTINFDNQRNEDLTSATVDLRRNGDAQIRLLGRTPWVFAGRWTPGANNDVELDITGFGNTGAEARGRITITRGGGFDHLEINGRSRGQRFTATFDADRREGWPRRDDNRSNDFVGNYRSSYQPRPGTDDYKIIRVLKIREDGSAELISRYQNRPPFLNPNNIRLHGSLLREIVARKKVSHTGSWRAFGRRLEVTLSNFEGNNRTVSRMTFESRDNDRAELTTTAWNQNDYGSMGFQFRRSDTDDDDSDQGGDPAPTPDRLAGIYSTRLEVPDSNGEIERTLLLTRDGNAKLSTSWVGGNTQRPSIRAVRELGRLIRALESQRTINQTGRWQYRNGQLVVDLGNTDQLRESASISFEVRGDTLDAVRVDQSMYGDRSFSLSRRR